MSQGNGQTLYLPPIEINDFEEKTRSRLGLGGRGGGFFDRRQLLIITGYVEQRIAAAIDWLIDTTESSKAVFAEEYAHQLQLLPSTIESELNTILSAAGPSPDFSLTGSITRELNAVRQLIHQRNLTLSQLKYEANLFFSSDPLTKSRQDFINTIEQRDLDVTPIKEIRDIYPAWATSYSAAQSTKLVEEALRQLNQRADSLTARYATALAQQAQQEAEAQALKAQQEAQARALEAQREAQVLRAQQEAEARALQAQREAEARALQAQREAETLKAQEEAKRVAQEQKRREDEQRLRAEQEAAKAKINAGNTYTAAGAVATSRPFIMGAAGILAEVEAAGLTLSAVIRAGVAELITVATAGPGALVATFASLALYSPNLGNGDRYAVSVPLSELDPLAESNWQHRAGNLIDLPVRIGAGLSDGNESYLLVATNTAGIPSSVRSVIALWDPKSGTYGLTTTETPPRHLTWTPIVNPGNSSTESPAVPIETPVYPGASVTPVQPQVETLPAIADLDFDDYIVWFPADSGLKPIYVAFRSRRFEPGVVSGVGSVVTGGWLEAASQSTGAPVPVQLADQLRGKQYGRFDSFRRAFWKAVANSPEFSAQFRSDNLSLLMDGRAPLVPFNEMVGGKITFEIHHKIHISKGGAVYDVDNLMIVTPKRHIEIHSGGKKYEE
ncbi:Pyocin-S2 [compost metagenome]